MTGQIQDTFLYNGEKYELVAFKGGELITPQMYGMEPEALHTACWRGFFSTYEITDKGLFLVQMTMHQKDGKYKPIDNTMPDRQDSEATYLGIRLLAPFTGTIRLA